MAGKSRLSVGCQLDLRNNGGFITMREIVRAGQIGDIHTITITGQHPLMLDSRPSWYFEQGCHGGTINDIAIHAVDMVPWLTGRKIAGIVAARAWNAKATPFPHFKDSAQFMLELDNGGGVLCDVSYLAPTGLGYKTAQYWRTTCHGDKGVVETNINAKEVSLITDTDKDEQHVPIAAPGTNGYFLDFLSEIAGCKQEAGLTTEEVLRSARITLMTQQAADTGATRVAVTQKGS